jgi:hypothetical protein
VVFSFFKKDQKDTKSGPDRPAARGSARTPAGEQRVVARTLNAPVNRSLSRTTSAQPVSGGGGFAVTENALPDREMARALAMATAAKIDAIESDMARDFLRPRKAGAEAQDDSQRDVVPVEAAPAPPDEVDEAPSVVATTAMRHPEQAPIDDDAYDLGSEDMGGSIDAIEVNGANSSVLDETAILFANRQDQAAENGLRTALIAESMGAVTERGWLMLLELIQQRSDRPAFDHLATQFAMRFGSAAPVWINYAEAPGRPAAPRPGMPVVQLPESIDAGIVRPLEEFKTLAMSHPALRRAGRPTRYIDLVGAELLLRVFNAFKRATHELHVRGAEPLLVALRFAVEPGRRDSSDAAWMLLLEIQRLLDRQSDFEETGIQYCITYEVSPPSWEPPPANIHASAAADSGAGRTSDPLDWKGEILGDGEAYMARLVAASRDATRIIVECRQLQRVAFTAGTSLLGQLLKLQHSGIAVEFRNVNCLIGALWQLLGVTAVADVAVRRS